MERFYGPYFDKDRKQKPWRVVGLKGTGPAGKRLSKRFETEAEALAFIGKARDQAGQRTVEVAVGDFLELLERRGARESTRATTRYRLMGLIQPVARMPLSELTAKRSASLYAKYATTHKPTTHHAVLKQAKAWGAWCVKQGWTKSNPWADIEPTGKRAHGKPQHRVDDTVKLYLWAKSNALASDDALAVLLGLLLGLRASEIVGLTKRDLDAHGTLLWVSKSKTQAGIRPVKLPEVLQAPLKLRSKRSNDRLLPYSRWWVLSATHRACLAARVPVITAHALRGGSATEALEAGEDPEAVARRLGQLGTDTLKRAYAQGGAGASAKAERLVEKLEELGERTSLKNSQPTSPRKPTPNS